MSVMNSEVGSFMALYDCHGAAVFALCLHLCQRDRLHAEALLETAFWNYWTRNPDDDHGRTALALLLLFALKGPRGARPLLA